MTPEALRQGRVQGTSMQRFNRPSRRGASFESLEGRRLFAAAPSALAADATPLVFSDVAGAAPTAPQKVTFSNIGTTTLTIPAGGVSIAGAAADQFHLAAAPTDVVLLAPGASLGVAVNYGATAIGPQGATLQVASDDPNAPLVTVALRGLGTKGEQG